MESPPSKQVPPPLLLRSVAELRSAIAERRAAGQTIALVPTMGALHAGHLSLVATAARECDCTVVTIFVNPTQFGPHEDLDRYPRTLEADLAALATLGVPLLVFAPEPAEVYPPGFTTQVVVAGPAEPFEGSLRPGHFSGVATVVLKLFNMTMPERAYFGQKDYQQTAVVRRLIADLDHPVELRVLPTQRDPDGLAMSSRNVYLSAQQRSEALQLSRALRRAETLYTQGERSAEVLKTALQAVLAEAPALQVEYATVVDAESLAEVAQLERPAVVLLAVRVGKTRLIDNTLLGVV